MTDNGSIDWQKTVYLKYYMAFAAVGGFTIFFAIALLAPLRGGIRSQLFLMAGYPVVLLIVFLASRSNKLIPRKYGTSRQKLYLQYREKLETYRWEWISRIYSEKIRGSTQLVIRSVGGEVSSINFLSENERKRIIDYYENQKERNKRK